MAITSAMASSLKQELLQAAHNFTATLTPTGSNTSGQFTWTSMSAVTNIGVGAAVSGTNVAAGSVVASIDSSSQITLSKASTGGPNSGTTLTIAADVFKIALFIAAGSVSGTHGAGSTNYSGMGADELATATGYTRPGVALTNVTPALTSTTAWLDFTPDPSWTSATFTSSGAEIYNSSNRLAFSAGRTCTVHNFGSDQPVSSGTLTVTFPTPDSSNAIIRIA